MSGSNSNHQYVICIEHEGYEASLELRKVYQVVSDPSAAEHGQIRVIDESGEDYLYPAAWFISIALPESAESVFPAMQS